MKEQVEDLVGVQKPINQIAKESKIKFFGHVTRHLSELRLANTIMHGRVPGNRGRGRPRRSWVNRYIFVGTKLAIGSLIRLAEMRELRIIQIQSASTDPERSFFGVKEYYILRKVIN